MRGTATGPNSPREIGVGLVMPRAMKARDRVEIEADGDDRAGHAGSGIVPAAARSRFRYLTE
jgi:hypothetical protein